MALFAAGLYFGQSFYIARLLSHEETIEVVGHGLELGYNGDIKRF
jgi:hypothetical protein